MTAPCALLIAAACLHGSLVAQVDPPIDQARVALAELTGGQPPTEKQLAAIADKVLAAGDDGLKMLATELAAAAKTDDRKRRDRLFTAVGHVAFRWIGRVEKSKMTYVGQYEPLKCLMPQVGEFYLELLLNTPEWFPITERWKVVPAVRDLFPKGPSAHTIDQIEIMARTEVEPEGLRVGLSYALAQWGRRDLIKQKLRRLERVAASEDAETATIAQRDIAMIHYAIRDYMPAAVAYREFLRRGEATGFALMPEHYYNTACCYCLIGDQRTALQFIEQSLALNKSAAIDSSMRLKRELFEKDPEIGLARRDPEFRKLLDREFGPAKPKPKPKPKLKPKHKSKQQSAPATGGKDQNGGKPGSGGRFRGTRHQAVR